MNVTAPPETRGVAVSMPSTVQPDEPVTERNTVSLRPLSADPTCMRTVTGELKSRVEPGRPNRSPARTMVFGENPDNEAGAT